jgi:hypothetical protein
MDGEQWMLEVRERERYHYISRWCPQDGVAFYAGQHLEMLAGDDVERLYWVSMSPAWLGRHLAATAEERSIGGAFSYEFVPRPASEPQWYGFEIVLAAMSGQLIAASYSGNTQFDDVKFTGVVPVPLPPAIWLIGSGLLGLMRHFESATGTSPAKKGAN